MRHVIVCCSTYSLRRPLFVRQHLTLIIYREVHSFGPSAIMINSDEIAVAVQESPLKALPLAKNNLIGVNVVTECADSNGAESFSSYI